MPNFTVRVTTAYEVTADTAEEAASNYEDSVATVQSVEVDDDNGVYVYDRDFGYVEDLATLDEDDEVADTGEDIDNG